MREREKATEYHSLGFVKIAFIVLGGVIGGNIIRLCDKVHNKMVQTLTSSPGEEDVGAASDARARRGWRDARHCCRAQDMDVRTMQPAFQSTVQTSRTSA